MESLRERLRHTRAYVFILIAALLLAMWTGPSDQTGPEAIPPGDPFETVEIIR
jgi:hypothetical protein